MSPDTVTYVETLFPALGITCPRKPAGCSSHNMSGSLRRDTPRASLPQRPLVPLLRIALVLVFRKRLRISWSTVAMVIIGAVVLAGLLSFFTWVLAL